MATLRKRLLKGGYAYVIDFRYQGERHVISTGTDDKKLAAQVLSEINQKIIRGIFRLEDYEQKDIRLSAFIQEYFGRVVGSKKPSTLAGERIYSKKLLRIIGDQFLGAIDGRVADHWKMKLLQQVSPATYNIELRVLKMLFNKAVEYGYMKSNPFKKLKKMRVEERRLYLYSSELKVLFDKLQDNIQRSTNRARQSLHYRFKLLCEVLLGTGMRREEALSLVPEQVDFQRNVIVVERAKSKKVREIPMTRRVREILLELKPEMFRGLSGVTASHKFRCAADAVGLKHMKLHSLRHTFATMLIAMGYDIKVVKELLGHEDIRITEMYAKAAGNVLQQAMESFGNFQESGYILVTRRDVQAVETKKLPKMSARNRT